MNSQRLLSFVGNWKRIVKEGRKKVESRKRVNGKRMMKIILKVGF